MPCLFAFGDVVKNLNTLFLGACYWGSFFFLSFILFSTELCRRCSVGELVVVSITSLETADACEEPAVVRVLGLSRWEDAFSEVARQPVL